MPRDSHDTPWTVIETQSLAPEAPLIAQLIAGAALGTEDRARIALDLGVTNLGGSVFSMKRFDYKLHLAGDKVAGGLVEALGAVAADTTQTMTLPIDLSLSGLGGAVVEAFTRKGRLRAKIKAGLQVGTPWGDVPLEIEEAEELDIKG
jgi:hypothetical protein